VCLGLYVCVKGILSSSSAFRKRDDYRLLTPLKSKKTIFGQNSFDLSIFVGTVPTK